MRGPTKHGQALDVTGIRFGILTAKSVAPKPPGGQGNHWHCECDCGQTKVVRLKDLRNGNTASCGCLQLRPKGKPSKHIALDLNRPWRKDEHVDDRWLVLMGQRSPVGAAA